MQVMRLGSGLGRRKINALRSVVAYAEHPQRAEIDRRVKIIMFFDRYGTKVTKEAFGISRSTVYNWKKKLKENNGKLISLSPISRAPDKVRQKERSREVEEFIKGYRNEHPKVGQEAIKPPLDAYCRKNNIKTISVATIGRILKELKEKGELEDSQPVAWFNIRNDGIRLGKKKYRKKLRRKGYKPEEAGDLLQVDSITLFLDNIKRYIITAIDVKSKFAFAYAYEGLSSAAALDFMQKLITVAPFKIKRIQTDNGLEFEHLFRDFVQKSNIVHFHNYPRHPQANACVERFNRTIQEQFVWANIYDLENLNVFNANLIRYLLWYNTERRHQTIRAAPLDYFLDNFVINKQKSNMLRDYTAYCPFHKKYVTYQRNNANRADTKNRLVAMIIDKLSNSGRYKDIHPGFEEAFDFLKKNNLAVIPDGRHNISDDRVYVTIATQKGKGVKESHLEKHSEYIDIHFVLEGTDVIGWRAFDECSNISERPEPGKDAESFLDEPDFYFKVHPGEFAIFFPEDCHAPLAHENTIRKGVIKVAV